MRRTLLLVPLCLAVSLVFAAAALAQEPGTEQYSESDYCEKKIGPKDDPFMSPSYKGEWEYDAINECIDARRQEKVAEPNEDEGPDEQQYGAEPDPSGQENNVQVDDPEAYPCTEVLGSPDSATGLASTGTSRRFGEGRVAECMDQLEAEAASPDPCAGPLFADAFAGLSTAFLAGSSGDFADPALVDPDGNGVICDSDEPAAQEQYDQPRVEDPEAAPCAEVLGARPAPRTQGLVQEADLVAPGQRELYGEERVRECLDQLSAETAVFANPTSEDYDVCSQPLFAELYAGLSTDYLYALAGADVLNEEPADPDGNGIICDSGEPADQEQYEEPEVDDSGTVSCLEVVGDPRGAGGIVHGYQNIKYGEERVAECMDELEAEAVSPDPCAGPLFADTFADLPTEYPTGTYDYVRDVALIDPDGNGIACDSTEPAVPAEPRPEETVPEERARALDPCMELSFAERYVGRPVAEAPNPEDPAIDPDGTGVVCGHVLAKHGYVPFGGEPETGKVLPLTGGPVTPVVVLLLGLGVLGAAALCSVARGA